MSIYPPTPRVQYRGAATMLPYKPPSAPTPPPPPPAQVANPPTNVTLAQTSGGGLSVTWAAPLIDSTHDAATGFNLRFSPSGAATWTVMLGAVSPYVLSGLSVGATIDVQLQSVNAAGMSAWSITTTVSTVTAAPNTPSGVLLAQGTGTDLTVSWTAPAIDSTHGAATGFNLQSSPSGANTWTIVSGVTSPYTLSGLSAGVAIDVQLEGTNEAGMSAWSAISTLTTASTGSYAPNAPVIASVAPPPDGTTSNLTVTWTAPAVDGTHDAATGYNLRSSPAGAGTWTTVTGVTSPFTLGGLAGATAIDVEVQATNAAANPGPWSAITTGQTWGTTVVPGSWTAATSQVHGTSVLPNGGVQMTLTPAPTVPAGGVFAWSASQSTIPNTALIVASTDGKTNGWGQYFSAPATVGTYYLWMLSQGAGGVTTGALVTSAITVS
jgi:hypothetical protein